MRYFSVPAILVDCTAVVNTVASSCDKTSLLLMFPIPPLLQQPWLHWKQGQFVTFGPSSRNAPRRTCLFLPPLSSGRWRRVRHLISDRQQEASFHTSSSAGHTESKNTVIKSTISSHEPSENSSLITVVSISMSTSVALASRGYVLYVAWIDSNSWFCFELADENIEAHWLSCQNNLMLTLRHLI